MRKQDAGFDYDRYRKLLAEAVDEPKRLALIDLLVEERAREQLELQRLADRKAMTARTIATVLGADRGAESLIATGAGLKKLTLDRASLDRAHLARPARPVLARPVLGRPVLGRPLSIRPVSAKPALDKPAEST